MTEKKLISWDEVKKAFFKHCAGCAYKYGAMCTGKGHDCPIWQSLEVPVLIERRHIGERRWGMLVDTGIEKERSDG
jgi:hypothetical protein